MNPYVESLGFKVVKRKILLLGTGIVLVAALIILSGRRAQIPEQQATDPQPVLPAPSKRLIPTIDIAKAKGWSNGAKPIPAAGLVRDGGLVIGDGVIGAR